MRNDLLQFSVFLVHECPAPTGARQNEPFDPGVIDRSQLCVCHQSLVHESVSQFLASATSESRQLLCTSAGRVSRDPRYAKPLTCPVEGAAGECNLEQGFVECRPSGSITFNRREKRASSPSPSRPACGTIFSGWRKTGKCWPATARRGRGLNPAASSEPQSSVAGHLLSGFANIIALAETIADCAAPPNAASFSPVIPVAPAIRRGNCPRDPLLWRP
jgi:hypothetical protein